MHFKIALSLLASTQLIAALPQQNTIRSFNQGVILEKNINTANIKTPGGKVTKIRYGPFDIPAMGMLENKDIRNVQKPCSDCYITAFQADLEDEAGRSVNTDKGAWLHHTVMYMAGSGEKDLVCPIQPAKRIFASGNETVRVSANGLHGIKVGATSRISLLYDLVNESDKPVSYYISMIYEISSENAKIKPAEVIYLDVTGNCGTAYVSPKDGSFTLSNNPGYTSKIAGTLLSATGHGHDGVEMVKVKVDKTTVCESQQMYAQRQGYTSMPGMGGMSGMSGGAMGGMAGMMSSLPTVPGTSIPNALAAPIKSDASVKHISDTGSCMDFGAIKIGDKIEVDAMYDTSKWGLNKLMGKYVELMGISLVYVAPA